MEDKHKEKNKEGSTNYVLHNSLPAKGFSGRSKTIQKFSISSLICTVTLCAIKYNTLTNSLTVDWGCLNNRTRLHRKHHITFYHKKNQGMSEKYLMT